MKRLRIADCGLRIGRSGYRVLGIGYRVSGAGYRVSGAGYRVSGAGYRVNPDHNILCHCEEASAPTKQSRHSAPQTRKTGSVIPALTRSQVALGNALAGEAVLRRDPKYNFEDKHVPKCNLGTRGTGQSKALKTSAFPSTTWERGRWIPFFIAILFMTAMATAENYNANNASLNLTTTDLSSSAAQSNGAGGRLVSAGTPGAGVVSINGAGAKGIFEPLNALSGAKGVAADFSASPLSGAAPLEVQFTDLSTGGLYVIQSWSWDFGDDTPASSEQNPKHTYLDPGSYTVTLTITVANDALSKTRTDYIVVANGVPAANYAGLLLLAAVLAAAGGANMKRKFSTTKRTK